MDSRQGEVRSTTAVVSGNRIMSSNIDSPEDSHSLFTVEQIFDLANTECRFLQTNCIADYDDERHFVAALAIYDWRVIKVEKFETCQSVEICP
jgi:hypothetical protein